ncbi:MAG: hypothetical protein ACI86C_001792, partial [Candidatus Latescibacterota bacterium]
MPRSRKTQVSLNATPYYHCSSRCVRRAFLGGKDALTGQSLAHRRQWIEDKLLELTTVLALDLVAYSVMHDHYHVVLFIDKSHNRKRTAIDPNGAEERPAKHLGAGPTAFKSGFPAIFVTLGSTA